MRAQSHLERALLADLRPTQMTVGTAEVTVKRAQWAALKRKARDKLLTEHWFPAVRGLDERHYIVDHHHLGVALLGEGVKSVWVMPLADFSALPREMFWRVMEFHQWAHPYNQRGERCSYGAIPRRLTGLQDDPYRSLAGEVRKAGGYAKDAAPYTEFLWAEFFRAHFKKAQLRPDPVHGLSPTVVTEAVAIARSGVAQSLPGWSGAVPASTP